MDLRRCAVLWMCSTLVACGLGGPWDEEDTTPRGGRRSKADGSAATVDAASETLTDDAGNVRSDDTGSDETGSDDPGRSNTGNGNVGRGDSGRVHDSGSTSGLDAGAGHSQLDAGDENAVVIGPWGSRDGGPEAWDPDAQGPVLNPEGQAACLLLTDNICNRVTECQASLVEIAEAQRASVVEACRVAFWRNHNCNRAVRTTSTFAMCAELTKTADCTTVFVTEFDTSCAEEIIYEP